MKELWQISRDYRNSHWVGVCPALQLAVEADSLPELRKSIEQAEMGPKILPLAMDEIIGSIVLAEFE